MFLVPRLSVQMGLGPLLLDSLFLSDGDCSKPLSQKIFSCPLRATMYDSSAATAVGSFSITFHEGTIPQPCGFISEPSLVTHTFNPSVDEVETEG